MNIATVGATLKEGQAALVVSEVNRLYLTGFAASDGYLLITREDSLFITDGRYIEDARAKVEEAEVLLQENVYEQIDTFLKAHHIEEILVEASRMTLATLNQYRRMLTSYRYNISGALDQAIGALRMVKTEAEKDKLQKAQDIASLSFQQLLPDIKPGVLERDVAAELEYLMRKNGADGISFDTIVVSGVNSSKPHGVPGAKAIETGDFVTIDFGALYQGYHSDTTRTVAVGKVTEEMANVYELVRKAQQAGLDAIRPGITCKDYDGVARKVITDGGYGPYFSHSLGHGVGVEIHEEPFCGPRSGGTLQAGNVISCEPGIYMEGKFGVRIEDSVIVTETGHINFCTLPKELLIL